MPMRVQNFPNETSRQSPNHLMPHTSVNSSPWWNTNGQHIPQSLSKNLSLKVGSPSQLNDELNLLAFAPRDKDSSSSQSTGQSDQEDIATEKTDSQDQCISSDSVQDGSHRKCEEGPMKPVMYMGNSTFGVNHPQVDNNMAMTHLPYAYADPYFNGLYNAYGPQAMIQHQMAGIAPARVPLPLELSEDGPIFVNAKQYQGIMRRRQARAKLEAQNKLIRNRKPYLHESRHQHALNRVRGSGGRFLPSKKTQKSNLNRTSSCHDASDLEHSYGHREMSEFDAAHQYEKSKCEAPMASSSGITRREDTIFQQSGHGFSGISSQTWEMRGNGALLSNGTYNRASIVR